MSEPLLKLAEALGYFASEYHEQDRTNYWITKKNPKTHLDIPFNQLGWEIFDPLNNAKQCLEIMDHFKLFVQPVKNHTMWYAYSSRQYGNAEGETINEAVLNCAKEIVG